jgi:hypothetical protein
MTQYLVSDSTTKEHTDFFTAAAAKKWMRERIKLGHEVSGSKVKIYSNGDWVNCGDINLTGTNKVFIANTRMTKANY